MIDAVTCVIPQRLFAFYIFIYLTKVLLFSFFYHCFFSEPGHMQKKKEKKHSGSFETKRLLLSRFGKENNQVFFYIVMFYILSLFKMFM